MLQFFTKQLWIFAPWPWRPVHQLSQFSEGALRTRQCPPFYGCRTIRISPPGWVPSSSAKTDAVYPIPSVCSGNLFPSTY